MAVAEDCMTVMEQFFQDSSNIGPEIQHIFEEIEAKEQRIAECRRTIEKLDGGLQKYTRLNGGLSAHPKEEAFIKTIRDNFVEMERLQDEKIVLAERNEKLLDRHVRRLDVKIRDLQADGNMPPDPTLPSLLNCSNANRPSMASTPVTGSSTPLNPISHNAAGPAPTIIANSGLARLVQPQVQQSTSIFAAPAQPHHPALTLAHHHANSAPATPASTSLLHQRHRESSAGANDVKRRRLQPHLGSVPSTSSGLARQSSVGPGTPKPGTPGASGVAGRAGSAGPRSGVKKTTLKKVAPHQQRKAPNAGVGPKKAGRRKKKSLLSGPANKATPSSDGEDNDSALTSASGSDSEMAGTPQANGEAHENDNEGQHDEEDEEEEGDDGGDDRKYCTCRTVSFGNMVACDNDNCPYEWFHWSCVGLTKEPPGKWFCEECRARLVKGS